VWPDADSAGLDYARAVAEAALLAGAVSVVIVSPPPEKGETGWDAADALAEGWAEARAAALIADAIPTDGMVAADNDAGATNENARSNQKRPSRRDVLVTFAESVELWHDADRIAYASLTEAGHQENWPVHSREFSLRFAGKYYKETGHAIGSEALKNALRFLEARAIHEGREYETYLRVARNGDRLYLDLCDDQWRAVEIGFQRWVVIENPPVKFLRSQSMRPLPEPEAGGMIEELYNFLNVRSEIEAKLIVGFLLVALRDRGPYFLLAVHGEQGSAKSTVCTMLKSLVDPSKGMKRGLPKDERDLMVSAENSHVLSYDNLSSIKPELADALCRLASGGGLATRQLHTDKGEIIFDNQRPVIVNGIPTLTDRADLADRTLAIHLLPIPEAKRRTERALWEQFQQARPRILGALCDALSAALRNFDSTKLDGMPRMADAVEWVTAAEPGLDWERGTFLEASRENRRDVLEATFEADAVAVAIDALIRRERPQGFEGTATELLAAINNHVDDATRKSKYWPRDPARLGNRLRRAAPLLREAKAYTVRHGDKLCGQRIITIVPPKGH
jgi:hypothetical protein